MSKFRLALALGFLSATGVACASNPPDSSTETSTSPLVTTAAGTIPAGLPQHMEVGLFEQPGADWMTTSGVPWDDRYAYFTYGWADNFGNGAHDGSLALSYFNESSSEGFTPTVEYYCINGEPGSAQSSVLTKAQTPATMSEYFSDFKLMLQQIKAFGKPVLVLVEADGFGYLEEGTGGVSTTYAAVADSGLPELASLPNTVAGWGLAFLQLRNAVGASNAVLGMHVSAWGTGNDIAYFQVTIPLQPQVETEYSFLAPFGLAPNQTGSTYNLLVGDPLDRDSDYYLLALGQNRWWDASDTASVNSESFNRYAAWLGLWNQMAQKRWILWQIPNGNSNALDVCNQYVMPSQGYKDNRPEYFFGTESAQHLAAWAQDGVIGLLFGPGDYCQSAYLNDVYTDGQLFIKSRVGAFYANGGLPLIGSGPGGADAGEEPDASEGTDAGTPDASTPDAGTSDAGTPDAGRTDTAEYNFETGLQGWAAGSGPVTVTTTTAEAFAGTHSLQASVALTGASSVAVAIASPSTPAGATVTFHVFVPAGTPITQVELEAAQGGPTGYVYTTSTFAIASLQTGAWNTLTLTIPANATTPLAGIGVVVFTNAAWSGTFYVDSVGW